MPPCPDSELHEAPGRVLKATPMERVVEAIRLLDALEGLDAARSSIVLSRDFGGWTCTPSDPGCHPVPTPTEAAEKALELAMGETVQKEAQKLQPTLMQPDLAPCPTCGGKALLRVPSNRNLPVGTVRIDCSTKRCPWGVQCVGVEEAVRRWNALKRSTFAAGSIEMPSGEIPAAALGPEEPRCGFCGGPHAFGDHGMIYYEELSKRELDAENQRLLDEVHEARQRTTTPDPPIPSHDLLPCPTCGTAARMFIPFYDGLDDVQLADREVRIHCHSSAWDRHPIVYAIGDVEAVTMWNGLPRSDRGFPKCKLCERQATSVTASEGPRCADHVGDTIGTKPIPPRFHLGAWGVKKEGMT